MADTQVKIILTIDGKQAVKELQLNEEAFNKLAGSIRNTDMAQKTFTENLIASAQQDSASIAGLNAQLNQLRARLQSAEIGSQTFRKIAAEIGSLTVRLKQAEAEAIKFSQQGAGALKQFAQQSGATTQAMVGLNFTLRDSPYLFNNLNMGIMAISNNIGPMLDGMIRMKQEAGSMRGFVKNLTSALTGPLGLSLALSAVVALIQVFSFVSQKAKKDTKSYGDELDIAKGKLEDLEAALEHFSVTAQQAGEIDIRIKEEVYKKQLEEVENAILILRSNIAAGIDETGIIGHSSTEIKKLQNELQKFINKKSELEKILTGHSPQYEKWRKQLDEIKKAGESLSGAMLNDWIKTHHLNINALEGALREMRKEVKQIDINSNKYKQQSQAIKNLQTALKSLTEQRKKDEAEVNKKKQQALVAQLEIDLIKDTQAREKAEIENWYKEKQKIAGSNQKAMTLLKAAYLKRLEELDEKYRIKEIEKTRSLYQHIQEITLAQMELEGASETEKLAVKKEILEKELSLYKEGSEQYISLRRTIEKLEIEIDNARQKEMEKSAHMKENLDELSFQNQIKAARMAGATEIEIAERVLAHKRDNLEKIKTAQYKTENEKKLAIEKANSEILDAEKRLANARIAQEERVKNAKKRLMNEIYSKLNSLIQDFYNQEQQKITESIALEYKKKNAALERERDERLNHAVTQRAKDQINKEYEQKRQQLERETENKKKKAALKNFEIEQGIAMASALMETYRAATAALSPPPVGLGPVAGVPYMSFITGVGLTEVGLIAAQEPPAFSGGGLFYGYGGTTDDRNLIRISNKEYIVKSQMVEKHFTLIDDANHDRIVYGGEGIIQELRALRSENREMQKELRKTVSKPYSLNVEIPRHVTGAIVQSGSYEIERGHL